MSRDVLSGRLISSISPKAAAMIATDSPCLTHEQLCDLTAGRLPGDRFARLLEHLDACPECQERAQSIETGEDSLVAALATPPVSDPHAAEPDCMALLHACGQPKHLASRLTPPVEQLGPYRLIRTLGSGGMGAVFLARHTRLRRQCAIKLLPRDRAFDASWRDRFDREMAAVANLDHPHVVAASDAGEAEGWHFLVMEYLDGLDLSRLGSRVGPLEVADACELARQAAVGLAHIHAAGLVHRDIKPSNLMLTRDGVVKILDLGLVLSGSDPLPADDRLTTVGQLMGTLAYMAPEQLMDSTTVDHRADLYALGATLFRLLTGKPPHGSARGIAPLVVAKTGGETPDVARYREGLPAPLVALVRRLLDRDVDCRPDSAGEVAETLQDHTPGADPKRLIDEALRKPASADESAATQPTPLQVIGASQSSADPPRRRWKRFLAAAAGLPLLLLAGIMLVIMTDRGELVIESEQAGVSVSIERGDEVVESLQLETGDNRVTLRSGTYTVQMDAMADGLQLDDQRATVTRGGETVLSVRRVAEGAATAIARNDQTGPRYQGKTLDHWLSVLETERDVETVNDAMRAVVELSQGALAEEEDTNTASDQRVLAAASMLKAARRWGGTTASNVGANVGGGIQSSQQRFMGHLLAFFPAFLPNPGLDAISNELAAGTSKSSMAAIWLLYNYAKGIHHDELYKPVQQELERWNETESGRVKLRELSAHLDHAVEQLGGYQTPARSELEQPPQPRPVRTLDRTTAHAITMAYETRLRLNEIREVRAIDDSLIGMRLKEAVKDAANQTRSWLELAQKELPDLEIRSGELQFLSDGEVRAAARELDLETASWAVVPSLFVRYHGDEPNRLDLLRQFDEEAPEVAADAVLATLSHHGAQILGIRAGGGGNFGRMPSSFAHGSGGGMDSHTDAMLSYNEPLLALGFKLVGQSCTKPELGISVFRQLHDALTKFAEASEQVASIQGILQGAIKTLESRLQR